MSNKQNDIRDLLAETLVIGTSLNATITAVPFQVSALLKWVGGGSLVIQGGTFTNQGVVYGSTFATNNQYLVDTNEIVALQLSGDIVLSAIGATMTCQLLRGLNVPVTRV